MGKLPKTPVKFVYWWAVEMPRRIFIIFKRLMRLTNNQLSFTLNIKLIFTPMFGDYTMIGRFIGFAMRIMQIIGGTLFMGFLTIATFAAPLGWWILPFYGVYEIKLLVLPIIALVYLFWILKTNRLPEKPLKKLEHPQQDIKKAMRPDIKGIYNTLCNNPAHGMAKLVKHPHIIHLLQRCELYTEAFIQGIQKNITINKEDLARNILDYAGKHNSRYVEAEQIFISAVRQIQGVENFLATVNSTIENIEAVGKWHIEEREKLAKVYIWQDDYEMLYTGGISKGMTGVVTPNLDAVSTDFTKMAQRGYLKKMVGREKEIKRIAEMLTSSKDDILIIGEPGSGKTSLIRGIAHKIIEGTDFKALSNKRLVSLELGSLIAGTSTAGQVAGQLNKVINDVKRSRDIIIFMDEIHNVVAGTDAGGAETSSILSLLEPLIVSPSVQVIGATTVRNYRKFIEPNGAFSRLFQVLQVEESSFEDTVEILKMRAAELETRHKIYITYPALTETVKLSKKLMHERVLPDKALDVLGRAASRVAMDTKVLTANEVKKEIAEMTNIPVESVTGDEAKKLLNIENEMRQMVIGQDHALKQIGSALKRARMGMRNENKPIASFLFIGTTGVGKTQTAKALAKYYFGNKKTMIRLDMSEYQQLDSLTRLIGSPDGSTRGVLTDAVRTKPFALVLLDEIEKAHPNILLTFLQVLDDGHLSDSSGRQIDFSNTIIIATSNVGTRAIQEVFGRNGTFDDMKTTAMEQVRSHYAPEFLNRFSGIIVYHPLSKENVRDITYMLLKNVKALAKDKGVTIDFSEELVDGLMERGYNPEWGARPLERTIEDSVESYMASKLLTNEIKRGDVVTLGTEVFEDMAG
jgi:ATP-dependent Clp protease ATP-binding subunit ClpC